jgi:hypothetical protein
VTRHGGFVRWRTCDETEERKAPWEPRSFTELKAGLTLLSIKESAFHPGKDAPACAPRPETVETRRAGMPRKKDEGRIKRKIQPLHCTAVVAAVPAAGGWNVAADTAAATGCPDVPIALAKLETVSIRQY